MALWLFRRKSRRKRTRTNTFPADEAQRPVPRSQTAPDAGATTGPSRKQSIKKQRTEPNKLQRRQRAYSFESGRRDSLHVGRKGSPRRTRSPVPPVPQIPGTIPPGPGGEKKGEAEGALGEDVFARIPTLHANKRDGQHLRQRKSSKRRKNSHDREREAELKAMSNFVPVRPQAETWTAGRPMKRDTKRFRSGLGIGFGSGGRGSWDKEHPSSDISLPIPESIHSSMSSDSEHIAYKVSALDVLAPKPTLRYASNPRWGATPSGGSMPQRVPSQKRVLSEKEPIPEATLKAHKRIHDLADDLSAGDLRELMERDKRRRERRLQKDQEKIERRLARRAEKQRLAAEAGAQNLERGVIGRETGLGIDPVSAVVTSSRRRPSDASPKAQGKQPEVAAEAEEPRIKPLDVFHRTSSMPLEVSTPAKELAEPVAPQSPPPPQSPKLIGFLRSKKSRSKSPPTASEPEKAEAVSTPRKISESSSTRGTMSWTSIFRWANKKKRNSGPSSFSNTSRDSMGTQTQPAAPAAPAVTYVPPRSLAVGVPRRTLSRFREDLPDFPISPPESRGASPEVDPIPPAIAEQDSPPVGGINDPVATADEGRYGTPTSDHAHSDHDPDTMRQTPTSWVHDDDAKPSPEPPHSMSMASIDSEGSWLSGRLGNRRRSSQLTQQRAGTSHSHHSQHQRHASAASDVTAGSHERDIAEDELADVADDEYLSRYARHSSGAWAKNRKSTGEARPSSDEDDDARLGAVGARVPMVVHEHTVGRVKSREGLMNVGDDGSEIAEVESPTSPASPISIDAKEEEAGLQRATSINLGQAHARHISAGSAKLLELSPRSSVDAKRKSFEPRAMREVAD